MTSLHVTLRQVVTWTFMNNLEHVNNPVLKAFTRKSLFDPLKRGSFSLTGLLKETFSDPFQIGSKTVIYQALPIPLCLIALMEKMVFWSTWESIDSFKLFRTQKWIKRKKMDQIGKNGSKVGCDRFSFIRVWSKTSWKSVLLSGSKWTF